MVTSAGGHPTQTSFAKCPAVSLFDAAVTEGGDYGTTVRRREQFFTFDIEVYRARGSGASVWLGDDSMIDSNCCHREGVQNEDGSGNNSHHGVCTCTNIHMYSRM